MMKRALTALFMFTAMGTAACSASGTNAQIAPERLAAIETYINERYPDEGAGVAALVAVEGAIVLEVNRGYANLEWGIRNNSDIAYRLGSISKTLTAIALLEFVEEGALDLDAPISTYVPDLPGHMGRVSASQLMSHTSGLAEHAWAEWLLPYIRSGIALRDVIEGHADAPIEFEPGAQYQYVNFNYTLLGLLLESLSGMSYSNYMEQQIFAVNNMPFSASDDRRDIVPRRAQNYSYEEDRWLHAENVDMSHVGAAGQLLASSTDLAHWSHLLLSGELVSGELRERAWTEVMPADGEPGGYGLGFNLSERNGHRYVYHTGMTPGAHGAVGMYPDEGIVIVVLGNGFHLPSTGTAVHWIADEIIGAAHD